jgi:glycosyltransferase involved in cell wall biosynthesis
VRTRRILAVVSAIDLTFRYGCTPAWWQIWKGMHEAGVDLILTPYRGPAIESPWWRTEPNPCRREGELYEFARKGAARLHGDTHVRRPEESPGESAGDRLARELILRYVNPRWARHLERIIERERELDAVLVFAVPVSHLRGIPSRLRERFGVPVVYFDADVPMSLPEYGGMDTGFNIYEGADLGEYDLVLSNSEGGLPRLRELGARRAEHLFWGADPELFTPYPVDKNLDVFFYAYGDKFRRDGMRQLVGEPSRLLPDVNFTISGTDFRGDTGRARTVKFTPVSAIPRAISSARINLNVARRPHASVYASSTSRLFELAATGAAIVTNPYAGIERWFEPGRELLVARGADEAVATYRALLDDPGHAEELGRRARERVIDEHTFSRRARSLLDLIDGVSAPAGAA